MIIYNCKIDNLKMLKNIIKFFTAYIYDIFISFFFTIAAHKIMINHMSLSSGNFLDIGCGTGAPLHKISDQIKKKHDNIVGLDMN